jgi:hypothetical protein
MDAVYAIGGVALVVVAGILLLGVWKGKEESHVSNV